MTKCVLTLDPLIVGRLPNDPPLSRPVGSTSLGLSFGFFCRTGFPTYGFTPGNSPHSTEFSWLANTELAIDPYKLAFVSQ